MKHEMFYMVWRESGGLPTFKHRAQESAMKEAERLAVEHPGERFHVLSLVATASTHNIVWSYPATP